MHAWLHSLHVTWHVASAETIKCHLKWLRNAAHQEHMPGALLLSLCALPTVTLACGLMRLSAQCKCQRLHPMKRVRQLIQQYTKNVFKAGLASWE
jgi:hypothetical protein